MRWQGGRRSGNIVDKRGRGGMIAGGGIGAVVLGLIAVMLGVDPGVIMQGGGGPGEDVPAAAPGEFTGTDEEADFVAAVLAGTEDTWTELFRRGGRSYSEPQLTLYENMVQSACGLGQSAMGPFYCPRDEMVYLDLSFFRDLDKRLGAPGDFAKAYVIAHEIGHHVQTITGISEQVRTAQAGVSKEQANAIQVKMELQADCYAGVWAFHSQQLLEPGDIQEALGAAAAIGDDRLQREAQGYVVPESFTHGTSAQRMDWFRRGYEAGDPARCDTFSAA